MSASTGLGGYDANGGSGGSKDAANRSHVAQGITFLTLEFYTRFIFLDSTPYYTTFLARQYVEK